MLGLDASRAGTPTEPREAATIILMRRKVKGVEVFCVERNKRSRFLGGAIVFPGGRVEESDRDDAWSSLVTEVSARPTPPLTFSAPTLRALGIAGCRETLEEAAILMVNAVVTDAEVRALRERHNADPSAFHAFLIERRLHLDLRALRPLSRWVTPVVEPRRYDATFFVAEVPAGQSGAHDMSETTSSFWASPAEVLERFERGELQLAPPTHRTLMQLARCATLEDVFAMAAEACTDPICPELVRYADTSALVLPGDREHPIRDARIAGPSRYVLRGDRWRAEDAP